MGKRAKRQVTLRQDRFIREYCVDFNGAQAAIRAGYSRKGARQAAYRLLSDDYIFQCIQGLAAADAAQLNLQRETVVSALLASIWQAEESGRVRQVIAGWREIARLLSLYPPRRKHYRDRLLGSEKPWVQMSDADLLRVAAGSR
jgi:phage terminase small subunit